MLAVLAFAVALTHGRSLELEVGQIEGVPASRSGRIPYCVISTVLNGYQPSAIPPFNAKPDDGFSALFAATMRRAQWPRCMQGLPRIGER
jgi:hypothetical protein